MTDWKDELREYLRNYALPENDITEDIQEIEVIVNKWFLPKSQVLEAIGKERPEKDNFGEVDLLNIGWNAKRSNLLKMLSLEGGK